MSIKLEWHADLVSKLMAEHGIRSRDDLAERLSPMVGRTSIYRYFDDTWAGQAKDHIMAIFEHVFDVPYGRLAKVVHESRQETKK